MMRLLGVRPVECTRQCLSQALQQTACRTLQVLRRFSAGRGLLYILGTVIGGEACDLLTSKRCIRSHQSAVLRVLSLLLLGQSIQDR